MRNFLKIKKFNLLAFAKLVPGFVVRGRFVVEHAIFQVGSLDEIDDDVEAQRIGGVLQGFSNRRVGILQPGVFAHESNVDLVTQIVYSIRQVAPVFHKLMRVRQRIYAQLHAVV